MIFDFALKKPAARAAVLIVTLVAGAMLGFVILNNFIAGTLADERVKVDSAALTAAANYFSGSARLRARLVEAEMLDRKRDLDFAESQAMQAIELSPWNYKLRLLLAFVEEAKGNREQAEQALRDALALAPGNTDLRWRLGNLLVREGKLDEAIDSFRAVIASNAGLLPAMLDLVWRASNGSLDAVSGLASGRPEAELALARFLLKESRPDEAARAFARVGRNARIDETKRAAFLNEMIAKGNIETAHGLWLDLVSEPVRPASEDFKSTAVCNGSFETDAAAGLTQFDWTISRGDYARIGIDRSTSRTGARSLRISFAGKDTTRLDQEIKQLVVVRPGARYRLECFVKTSSLVTTEGPQVVVTPYRSPAWLAASDPVAAGSNDWQQLAVDFTAPLNSQAIFITIKRKPKFSYDDPTQGTVWFDDFTIKEQEPEAGIQK